MSADVVNLHAALTFDLPMVPSITSSQAGLGNQLKKLTVTKIAPDLERGRIALGYSCVHHPTTQSYEPQGAWVVEEEKGQSSDNESGPLVRNGMTVVYDFLRGSSEPVTVVQAM